MSECEQTIRIDFNYAQILIGFVAATALNGVGRGLERLSQFCLKKMAGCKCSGGEAA